LDAWPRIEFTDDRDGCLFTATVHRPSVGTLKLASGSLEMSEKTSEKTSEKILAALRQDGSLTIAELASRIGVQNRTIERNIKRLQEQDRLRRVGPDKGGRWEVIEGKNE
jgi:ATP-dependent DNA helicase RecG